MLVSALSREYQTVRFASLFPVALPICWVVWIKGSLKNVPGPFVSLLEEMVFLEFLSLDGPGCPFCIIRAVR